VNKKVDRNLAAYASFVSFLNKEVSVFYIISLILYNFSHILKFMISKLLAIFTGEVGM